LEVSSPVFVAIQETPILISYSIVKGIAMRKRLTGSGGVIIAERINIIIIE
jgi:hypothetical protein